MCFPCFPLLVLCALATLIKKCKDMEANSHKYERKRHQLVRERERDNTLMRGSEKKF